MSEEKINCGYGITTFYSSKGETDMPSSPIACQSVDKLEQMLISTHINSDTEGILWVYINENWHKALGFIDPQTSMSEEDSPSRKANFLSVYSWEHEDEGYCLSCLPLITTALNRIDISKLDPTPDLTKEKFIEWDDTSFNFLTNKLAEGKSIDPGLDEVMYLTGVIQDYLFKVASSPLHQIGKEMGFQKLGMDQIGYDSPLSISLEDFETWHTNTLIPILRPFVVSVLEKIHS